MVSALVLPGVHVEDYITGILIALVLALFNVSLKPLMIIVTIPVTIFTFGLFLLVINALMIILAAKLVPGFEVDGFWWALLFSILLSLITSLFMKIDHRDERQSGKW